MSDDMDIGDHSFLVCVKCWTYNHAPFIKDAMDGFTKQSTSFPYVCVIVDDASTDGEPDVIREYISKYFEWEDHTMAQHEETDDYVLSFARHKSNRNCFFAVLFLKYNHHGKKPKGQYLERWVNKAKYIALCEGDDYWTDSFKLQKQVSLLEQHPEVVFCCTGCLIEHNGHTEAECRYDKECIVPVEDIIVGGGLWFHTVTFVHSKSFLNSYPNCCKACHVGDYPLVIWAALNGSVYYLPDVTAVYRFQSSGSWTSRQNTRKIDNLIRAWRSEVNMLEGLDELSEGRYSSAFNYRIRWFLYDAILNHKEYCRKIVQEFHDEIKLFGRKQKLHVLALRTHMELVFLFCKEKWDLIKRRLF